MVSFFEVRFELHAWIVEKKTSHTGLSSMCFRSPLAGPPLQTLLAALEMMAPARRATLRKELNTSGVHDGWAILLMYVTVDMFPGRSQKKAFSQPTYTTQY